MLTHDALIRLCRARECLREADAAQGIHALAREAGFSTGVFIRHFSAVFGTTPHQLRIASRIDRAKRLLAEGGASITDVCYEVGFESLGSFSDLFARRVGVAPTAYRRRWHVAESLVARSPGCLDLMAAAFARFERA